MKNFIHFQSLCITFFKVKSHHTGQYTSMNTDKIYLIAFSLYGPWYFSVLG
jgi:hypothetical protein